jgi:RNA polymerase sigma factor (sigma-70 family)
MYYRDTWVEIDLDRIAANVSAIKRHSGYNDLFAVVKANAYLKQVAHGLCVDHWRRAAVQQAWEETLALTPEALHPSPEDTHILIEELVAVKAMLDDLPVPVRTTLLLSHLHGLTYKAVAEQLDVSERTVKKYMASAMARCALHMDAF